jgi:chromosome segregation protein
MRQICWQREQKMHSLELQIQHLEEQLEENRSRALEQGVDLLEVRSSTEVDGEQSEKGQSEKGQPEKEQFEKERPEEKPVELDRHAESKLKEQIAALREKLGEFGEVNFTAPGEYAAQEERHTFLLQQREDLLEGRRALLELIGEMDRIVSNRFRQLYEDVRRNFEEICAIMFDGGKAELFLTDPGDLMTTGIDLRVLPRGKKPRHISLLSGGEKALAGICFLFALLRAKPSPFYVLDEIEAFLDESNLTRFTDLLSAMARHAQIILISHRPQTMQMADALYGITMEEPGVSKLVAVELAEPAATDDAGKRSEAG